MVILDCMCCLWYKEQPFLLFGQRFRLNWECFNLLPRGVPVCVPFGTGVFFILGGIRVQKCCSRIVVFFIYNLFKYISLYIMYLISVSKFQLHVHTQYHCLQVISKHSGKWCSFSRKLSWSVSFTVYKLYNKTCWILLKSTYPGLLLCPYYRYIQYRKTIFILYHAMMDYAAFTVMI